jgi:hypothetical protein
MSSKMFKENNTGPHFSLLCSKVSLVVEEEDNLEVVEVPASAVVPVVEEGHMTQAVVLAVPSMA